MTIVGARPQFVKAAMVSRALARRSELEEIIVHTGQHFDSNMSDVFFDELKIPAPRYNLGIGGGSHGENTGRALEAVEKVIQDENPALVMVYGDTDSTLAGALAAAKLCIPVAHVEAGLRSFNRRMPEEINRVVTDHISAVLFVPSHTAVRNLAQEGIDDAKVHFVGDVMFDAVRMFSEVAARQSRILDELALKSKGYVLVTVHRKENTDDPVRLKSIVDGLSQCESPVVLPLHPRTQKRLTELGSRLNPGIRVIEPVGYLDMQWLEHNAQMIATDSGGVQKEAYFHGVPCLTLRDETEWVELIESGFNRLVGADAAKIAAGLREGGPPGVPCLIFGAGEAAEAIAGVLARVV
jgi:UDP-GlcNAc3NAcA epimerase